eukprot:86855-Chlamydomonas_euryale.AAC.5
MVAPPRQQLRANVTPSADAVALEATHQRVRLLSAPPRLRHQQHALGLEKTLGGGGHGKGHREGHGVGEARWA